MLLALVGLGVGYLFLFGWLRAHSTDFLAARRNAEAATRAAAFAPGLPQVLKFKSTEPAAQLLGTGWHAVEPDGVWSWRSEAVVQLRFPQPPRDLELTLEALPYVNVRRPQQSVDIWLGAQLIGTAQADLHRLYQATLVIPAALQSAAVLPLRLQVSHVGSPFRDDPAVRDSRQLGLKLLQIGLRERPRDAAPP